MRVQNGAKSSNLQELRGSTSRKSARQHGHWLKRSAPTIPIQYFWTLCLPQCHGRYCGSASASRYCLAATMESRMGGIGISINSTEEGRTSREQSTALTSLPPDVVAKIAETLGIQTNETKQALLAGKID